MNLIITSELRVGSRWLHYLLHDLLDMNVSPEIDATLIRKELPKVRDCFNTSKIVKFHHATPAQIVKIIKPIDYQIIGVVRNPRDRAVSRAFHRKYGGNFHRERTDWEAVHWTVLTSKDFNQYTTNQFNLMLDGYSTRRKHKDKLPYIWTSYEWMLENMYFELRQLVNFLGIKRTRKRIKQIIAAHSFTIKSGRQPGNEQRTNEWRRKGVMSDWTKWYNEEMVLHTSEVQEKYWRILHRNNAQLQ